MEACSAYHWVNTYACDGNYKNILCASIKTRPEVSFRRDHSTVDANAFLIPGCSVA